MEKGSGHPRSSGILLVIAGVGGREPGPYPAREAFLEARATGSRAGASRAGEVASGCGGDPPVPSPLEVTAKIQPFATLSCLVSGACVLKCPSPGNDTGADDAEKCPGAAVEYC